MGSAAPSGIGPPSAPTSRRRLLKWRSPTRSATSWRPPTGAATCSRNVGRSWRRGRISSIATRPRRWCPCERTGQMSTDQQPDMPGQDEDKIESEPPPVTEIDVPEPKWVRGRLSDLRRQPTDEDNAKRAEELRRLEMTAKGQHPDTGKTLRPGDANSFHSATEKMQEQTYLVMREADRLNPIRPHVRAIIDAQASPLRDPARQAIDQLGLNQYALGARSGIDDLAARDPYS